MEKQTFMVRLPSTSYAAVKEAVERLYGGGALMWDNGKAYPTLEDDPVVIERAFSENSGG